MRPARHATDVVIAGAGVAGIAAAIEALGRGRRVLLVDRDSEEHLGGLAKESFGGLWFAGTPLQRRYRIPDSVELGLQDWLDWGELGSGESWPRAWARAYVERCVPDVFHWLTGFGVQFMPMPMWIERGLYQPGNSVPRFHIVWGTGHALATTLRDHLLNHPQRERLELRFGHRVDALTTAGSRISGVSGVVEPQGQIFEFAAESIVIATGGINGDLDRVRRNWPGDWGQPPAVILNGSTASPMARCTMRQQQSEPASRTSTGSGTTRPASGTGARASRGMVSRSCRRSRRCGSTRAANASARCRS